MNKDLVQIIGTLREHWLGKLKGEQIETQLALYIPTMLGYTEKDEVNKRLSGIEDIQRFLANDKILMLLQGDSGAGKSLFGQCIVNYLWERDQDIIPLFIHLPYTARGKYKQYKLKASYFSTECVDLLLREGHNCCSWAVVMIRAIQIKYNPGLFKTLIIVNPSKIVEGHTAGEDQYDISSRCVMF